MNRLLPLATLLITSTLASTLAFATEPTPKPEAPAPTPAQASAEKAVQAKLLQPLATNESERSRFSRARMPPQARRVRVLDAEPQKDSQGAAFLRFAVDARHGFGFLDDDAASEKGWRKDMMTGCVYVEGNQVFIQRGEGFMTVPMLLGRKSPLPGPHVCKTADGQIAQR